MSIVNLSWLRISKVFLQPLQEGRIAVMTFCRSLKDVPTHAQWYWVCEYISLPAPYNGRTESGGKIRFMMYPVKDVVSLKSRASICQATNGKDRKKFFLQKSVKTCLPRFCEASDGIYGVWLFSTCPSGGMADTHVLGTCAERRKSSSLLSGITFNSPSVGMVIHIKQIIFCPSGGMADTLV